MALSCCGAFLIFSLIPTPLIRESSNSEPPRFHHPPVRSLARHHHLLSLTPIRFTFSILLSHPTISPTQLIVLLNLNRNCNRDRDGLLRAYLITNHPIFLLL
ncbi:hypothetical protein L2E82_46266 [Cichorium intybus]|uniref:Uncharacterized protein n=1 Tax=Cichorium intybus TaxID=13427 RepID=A0ACB8YU35_CICIN|nr:hypothetical protein L2E82_46266 [Cichorium intybus]